MQIKTCTVCKRPKYLAEFRQVSGKTLPRCSVCENKRLRDWHKSGRIEMIAAYGGKCSCCGETNYEFLALDHVEGGGLRQRKDFAQKGRNYAQWLLKQYRQFGVSKDFRVLCHNCNQSLGLYGFCPHQGRPAVPFVRAKGGIFIPEEQPLKEEPRTAEELEAIEEHSKAIKRAKRAESAKKWRKENPQYRIAARKQNQAFQRKRHAEAVSRYGGACKCCGERLVELLRVAPLPGSDKCPPGKMIGQWLNCIGYPEGYEVRCISCMRTHEVKGYCPHMPNLI